MARDLLELQQHLGGLQRIATKLEKIVVDADVGPAEQTMPDLCDLDLQRRIGKDGTALEVGERSGELRPRDLAGGSVRQALQHMNLARHLERRQQVIEEVYELRRCDAGAWLQHDGRPDILAQPRMRHREGCRLAHRQMAQQRLLDVVGRDLLAAAIDDLLGAADDGEETLLVDHAQIARRQPIILQAARHAVDILQVARRDARPAQHHLPDLTRRQEKLLVAPNGELVLRHAADSSGPGFGRRQRRSGHHARLAQAVELGHRHVEHTLQLAAHAFGKIRRRRQDEAQRVRGFAQGANFFEHGLQERRRGRQPGRSKLGHPLVEFLRIGRARHRHAAADQQRDQQRRLEPRVVIDRQNAGGTVGRRKAEPRLHLARHLDQVLVGDRHALGRTGRAGRAEDGGHRLRPNRHGGLRVRDGAHLGEHDVVEGGHRLRDLEQAEVAARPLRPSRNPGPARHDQRIRADLFQLGLQIVRRQVRVERQDDGVAADGDADQRRFRAARQGHAHARPWADTGRLQLRRDAPDLLL